MMEKLVKFPDGKNIVCTLEIEGGTQHVLLKPQKILVEKYTYNEPVVVTPASCPNCPFPSEGLTPQNSFVTQTENDPNATFPETKDSARKDRSHRRVLGWRRSYHKTIIDENIKTMVQLEDERSSKLYENSTDEEKLRLAQTQPYWLNVYAAEDVEMIPYIEKEENKLSAWKDVKELLFPRCQDPCCIIVLSCLKQIFKYPTDLKSMHSCTEQEQSLFMRRFKMVQLGSLLVSLLAVREQIDLLTELVENKHKGSKAKCWYKDFQCLKCMSKPRIKTATERRTEARDNVRPNTSNGSMTQQQEIANKGEIPLPVLCLPDDVAHRLYTSSISSLGPDVEEDTVEFPVLLAVGDEDILVPCSVLTHIYPQCYNILTYLANNLIMKSFTNNQIIQATARQAAAFNYWIDIQDNHTALSLFTSGSLMMKLSDFSLATIGLLPLQTRQFLLVSCDWSHIGDKHSTSGLDKEEDKLDDYVTPCSDLVVRFYNAGSYEIYDEQVTAQSCEKAPGNFDVHEFVKNSQVGRSGKESDISGMKLVKKKTLLIFDKEPVSPFRSPRKSKLKQKRPVSRTKNPPVQLLTEQDTMEPNSFPIPIKQSPRMKSGKKAPVASRQKSPYLVQPFIKNLVAETTVGNTRSCSPNSSKVINNKHRQAAKKMQQATDQIEKESGNITRKVQLRPKPVNLARSPKETTSQPLPFRKSPTKSPEASYSQNSTLGEKTTLKKNTAARESPRVIRSNLCTKLRNEWREKHMRENLINVSKNTSHDSPPIKNLKEIMSTETRPKSCLRREPPRMVVGSSFGDDNFSPHFKKTNTAYDSFKEQSLVSFPEEKLRESGDRDNAFPETTRNISPVSDCQMNETEMSLHDVCNHKEAGNSPTPPWEAYNLQLDDHRSHSHRFNTGLARISPQPMSRSPSTKAYDFGGSNTIYDEYSISASTSIYAASSTSSVQFNQENSHQFEFCPGPDPSFQDADNAQTTPYSRQISSETMAFINWHDEKDVLDYSRNIAFENSESSKYINHQAETIGDSAPIDHKIHDMSSNESRVECEETTSKIACAANAFPTESSKNNSVSSTNTVNQAKEQHQMNEIPGKYVFIPDILNITGIIHPGKPQSKTDNNDKKEIKVAKKPRIKEVESKISRSDVKKPQHIQIHSCMELRSPQISGSLPQQSISSTDHDHLSQSPRNREQTCKHETLVGRSCPELTTIVTSNDVSTKSPRPVYLHYDVKARRSAGAVLQGSKETRPFFYGKGFIPGRISRISRKNFQQYREKSCQQVITNSKPETDTSDALLMQKTNNETLNNQPLLAIKGTASFPSLSNTVVTGNCPDCILKRDKSVLKTEQTKSTSQHHNSCGRRGKVYIAPSPSTESILTAQNTSEAGSFFHMPNSRQEAIFESGMYQGNQNPATWEAASNYLAALEEISNLEDDLGAISLQSYKRQQNANAVRSLSLCRECTQSKGANEVRFNTAEKETDHESIAKAKGKEQRSASKIVNVVFQYHHQNQPRRATTAYMSPRQIDHSIGLLTEKERPHSCDPRQRALKTGRKLKIFIDLMNGAPKGKQLTNMCPLEIKKIGY